jgi:hypothetical protein
MRSIDFSALFAPVVNGVFWIPVPIYARRSAIAHDVRSPKYRPRSMPNRKRIANKRACRERVPFSKLP